MTAARETAEQFFNHPHYKLNKFFMKKFGFWPYDDAPVRAAIMFLIVVVSSLTVVAPEVVLFVQIFGDVSLMVELLPGFLTTYMVFVVVFNNEMQIKKIREILDQMQWNKLSLDDEEEKRVLDEYAATARFWIVRYAVMLLSCLALLPVGSLKPLIVDLINPLNESRPLEIMFKAQYFVDTQKSSNFLLILVHQWQGAFSNIAYAVAFDTYYLMILFHACSTFVILGIQAVGRLNVDLPKDMSCEDKDKLLMGKIGECVRYHMNNIRFFNTIEDSQSTAWFMQVFTNMLLISVIGAQMMFRRDGTVDRTAADMLSSAMNIGAALGRLYWVCWPAQKLTDCSSDVRDILYQLPWYDLPPKSKRAIFIMIVNSENPCTLTAGKTIFLNFETFSRLANMSYSYFTMLLSF